MRYSLLIVLTVLLLVACGGTSPDSSTSVPSSATADPSAPTAASAAATAAPRALDPIAVLNTYDFAKNGKDVEAALALFAPDAVVAVPSGVFTGTAEIQSWLEREAQLNSQTQVVGQRTVQGETVTWRSRITRDDIKQLGVAIAEADDQAVVQDGKIKSFTSTLTPDTQARLNAAQGIVPTLVAGQVLTPTIVITPTITITPTVVAAATAVITPTVVVTPTTVISAGQPISTTPGFAQLGAALNRDKTSAATEPDIASGALDAGSAASLWAAWAEKQGNSQQIFVSRLNNGAFEPVGASLNVHTNVAAEAPSLDFAGADRTVPWIAWSEPSPGFGNNSQIFASRFNKDSGLWVSAGQDRGGNESSLNIHTNKPATNPVLVGGSLNPANPPVPWVCWQEVSGQGEAVEIFVTRGERDETGAGGFKWVPVGANEGGTPADPEPSLNIDPEFGLASHCGLAFAGENNTVPWVVWSERIEGKPVRIFARRGAPDTTALGGLRWDYVPGCIDASEEEKCILNVDQTKDALDPVIAAGSLNATQPASPWIVWSEVGASGAHQILVNRLDPATGNRFLNVGGSLNVDQSSDARSPTITIVRNVPYVAWQEEVGAVTRIFVRHLEGDAGTGTWVLDTPQDGLAVDKGVSAYAPVIQPYGNGVAFIYRQGDPLQGAVSQIIVCAGIGGAAQTVAANCQ